MAKKAYMAGSARVGCWPGQTGREEQPVRGERHKPPKLKGRSALTQKTNEQAKSTEGSKGARGRRPLRPPGLSVSTGTTRGARTDTGASPGNENLGRVTENGEADRELILVEGNLVVHGEKREGAGRAEGEHGGKGNLPSAARRGRAGGARQKISLRETVVRRSKL